MHCCSGNIRTCFPFISPLSQWVTQICSFCYVYQSLRMTYRSLKQKACAVNLKSCSAVFITAGFHPFHVFHYEIQNAHVGAIQSIKLSKMKQKAIKVGIKKRQ